MSEPTYRVELTHRPENGLAVQWQAAIYLTADWDSADGVNYTVHDCFGADREQAFNYAQGWIRAKATEPQAPSTVFLTEDGDILDPHEVQR